MRIFDLIIKIINSRLITAVAITLMIGYLVVNAAGIVVANTVLGELDCRPRAEVNND